eukprot:TRINITY_DN60186_c0_g1_i1.p1 TRINITY_DN60186_c0_g1~~TRINITY_DN60186_c0_g1_i1.p1  ORF type:complete len:630 (+),score=357.60 TRINITY_DN60186_c0_g1_i1:155-1891(+)
MYIMLALTVKGSTAKQGVTDTSNFVDVLDFFGKHISPELQGPLNQLPVLRADCLKFVSVFRHQIPGDAYASLLPIFVKHMQAESYVVRTYAANAVDRLLSVKDNGTPRLSEKTLQPHIQSLLKGLFGVLAQSDSEENEYVMKAILQVCAASKASIAPFVQVVLDGVKRIMVRVSQNPLNPRFNHYLFETVSCLIANICGAQPALVASFEKMLFPVFTPMLSMESCDEFGAYVFQLVAQMLQANKQVTAPYTAIFPSLLAPAVWANTGNTPALVMLLRVYLMKNPDFISGKIPDILNIFQKLMASRKLDRFGMELLTAIVEYTPMKVWAPFSKQCFTIMFQKLQAHKNKRKNPRFVRAFVVFLSRYTLRHGTQILVQTVNQIQDNIFFMVLERVWSANVIMLSTYKERRTCALALIRVLRETASGLPTTHLAAAMVAIARCASGRTGAALPSLGRKPSAAAKKIANTVMPANASNSNNTSSSAAASTSSSFGQSQQSDDVVERSSTGFSTAFARLVYAELKEATPMPEVQDLEAYVRKNLMEIASGMQQQWMQGMQGIKAPDDLALVQQFMQNKTQENH